MTNDIQVVLKQLVGQRCEGVDNPYGSILRLDLGPLGRRSDDSLTAPLHGWRHLTVLCPWRLESPDEVLADWNLKGGFDGQILSRTQVLRGLTVAEVAASPPAWDLTLVWSNGLRLCIFSDSDEDRSDAWVILGTDGLELGVRPTSGGVAGYELKMPQPDRD
jgi:hypothetical protein